MASFFDGGRGTGDGIAASVLGPPSSVSGHTLGFTLFLATALSITAIPVLGRVMVEFNIQRTELGVLTITAAAIDDALGWILLAVVSAIVGAHFDPMAAFKMVAMAAAFALGMALI